MRPRVPRAGARPAADDPIAALDRDLAWLAARLRMARYQGEQTKATRLSDAIDMHLDERHRLSAGAPTMWP